MTVYVVQEPMYKDARGQLRSKFDFTAAQEFGPVRVLIPENAKPWDPNSVTLLHEALEKFADGDWLILTGNPCLMGAAAAIVSAKTDGRLRFLQWHGGEGCYKPVSIDVGPFYNHNQL